MYDKGYVLVSPHDMATVNDDGTMSRGKIMVPEGKIPFVLSQDDVSYYHYMDGDGCASKLVLDENGQTAKKVFKAEKQDCDNRPFSFAYPLPAYGVAVFQY